MTADIDEFMQEFSRHWCQAIPFNQVIGMELTRFSPEQSEVCFNWQDKLVGNHVQKILHGGVTSSVLDYVGGAVCAANIITQERLASIDQVLQRLSKMGTIDLRTDYLRPGRGERFIATAHIIRSGRKVAVARMEMHNEKGDHIAFGTGTYMVG